jgi:hypothetical protein
MELHFDDDVVRGLRRYVQLVSQALGLRGECSYLHTGEPASAYIALDGELEDFPDRDVALLWNETHGWSAAIETHRGQDLLIVAHLGQDVLPPPETVAAWTKRLFHQNLGQVGWRPNPPSGDVRRRLATYAGPAFVATPSPS